MNDISLLSPALLSPPDERDYTVGSCMEVSDIPIPPDYAVWQPPVENQGSVGNCVAQALANILECIDHRRGRAHADFSVGYLYGTQSGYGMYPRQACAALTDEGDVYRAIWECLEENPACYNKRQAVGEDVKRQAQRALAYVRLHTKEEAQRFMLKYGLPVLITSETANLGAPLATGLHAVACYGWQDTATCANPYHRRDGQDMLYQNSWGTGGAFGDGRGAVRFDKILELWGIVPMEKRELADIRGHWAEKEIERCVEAGLVDGYEDNTFKPEQTITRAECAKLFARMLDKLEGK